MSNLLSFFPNGFEASKYSNTMVTSSEPPVLLAHKALCDMGFKPPFLQEGRLLRFPDKYDLAKGDKRGQGGWAIFNSFDINQKPFAVMTFGSWHEGDKQTWTSISQDYMDTAQRAAMADAIDAARRIRDEEERRQKEIAQAEFSKTWEGAKPADDNHPYLVKKRVKAHGIRSLGDKLLIPMGTAEKLVGLQTITPDGTKKFERHSTKGFYILGNVEDVLFISEGYSTAATIHEATGKAVAVAFDAGNLFPVASALKGEYPAANIIIAADDDKHGEINTGMVKAKQAADALGLRVIVPLCDGTDFNDMAYELGIESVTRHIESSLAIKQPKKRAAECDSVFVDSKVHDERRA